MVTIKTLCDRPVRILAPLLCSHNSQAPKVRPTACSSSPLRPTWTSTTIAAEDVETSSTSPNPWTNRVDSYLRERRRYNEVVSAIRCAVRDSVLRSDHVTTGPFVDHVSSDYGIPSEHTRQEIFHFIFSELVNLEQQQVHEGDESSDAFQQIETNHSLQQTQANSD